MKTAYPLTLTVAATLVVLAGSLHAQQDLCELPVQNDPPFDGDTTGNGPDGKPWTIKEADDNGREGMQRGVYTMYKLCHVNGKWVVRFATHSFK